MAVFVLVHGAFHGGWCYARVARLLRHAGHDVYTPTLTGLGERSHLAGLSINLSTHIDDVVGLLHWEALSGVILCGHSYGGMVITGVAARVGERIRSLVYLDAIVPEDGQSLFDAVGPELAMQTLATTGLDGRVPSPGAAFFNVNRADAAQVDRLCVPQPIATFLEAIRLTGKAAAIPNRTYILAENYDFALNQTVHERLSRDPAWRTTSIASGHDVMIDAPEALAESLIIEAERGLGPPAPAGFRAAP